MEAPKVEGFAETIWKNVRASPAPNMGDIIEVDGLLPV
jgi:hypothetical protein